MNKKETNKIVQQVLKRKIPIFKMMSYENISRNIQRRAFPAGIRVFVETLIRRKITVCQRHVRIVKFLDTIS